MENVLFIHFQPRQVDAIVTVKVIVHCPLIMVIILQSVTEVVIWKLPE